MEFEFNWIASLVSLILTLAIVAGGRYLLFRVPAFAHARDINKQENKHKWRNMAKKYHHRVKVSQKIGLGSNLAFFVLVLPFFVTLEAQSLGQILLGVFLILMVYDFFYYLTHRFLFHGQGYLRRVHAVHHQARSRITSIDSQLLHPAETFIGIGLFFLVTALLAITMGQPFHVATIVICNVIYTQLNQLNHCKVDVGGPFKVISWIANSHDAHHQDMHKGNYATLTLLYDKLFGTLEPPVTAATEGVNLGVTHKA